MQYSANGASFFVSKYFVRKRMERYAAAPADMDPAMIGPILLLFPDIRSSGNFKAAAAKMIGVAKRNEKHAALS